MQTEVEILSTDVAQGDVLTWTEFDSTFDQGARACSGTFIDLVRRVAKDGPESAGKSVLPLIKLGRFGALANPKSGMLRHEGNLLVVSGLEGDHDAGLVSVEEAIQRLERHGIRAAIVTTATHQTDRPRWRVLAPFSRELLPAERSRMVARLNGALGGCLAGESFVTAQAFFFGRVKGVPFASAITFGDAAEGQCIDLLDELDEVAIGRRQETVDASTGEITTCRAGGADRGMFEAAVRQAGRKLRTGDGRRGLVARFAGSLSREGLDAAAIEAEIDDVAATYFDPRDPIDEANIQQLVRHIVAEDERLREIGARAWEAIKASAQRKAAQRSQAVLVPVDERAPLEPLPTLVRDFLPLDGVGMLWAEPGTYKSFLALDVALCVASGLPWLGRSVAPGRVWYVAGEGQSGLRLRIAAWRKARDYEGPIDFLHTQRALTLDDEGGSPGLDTLLKEAELGTPPSLIVVDTLARAMTGDESSTRDASRFVAALDRLVAAVRKAGQPCCVMLVHHSRKDGEVYRGSSVLRGAADFEYEMRKTGKLACALRPHKVKDGNLPPEVHLLGRVVPLGWRQDNHGTAVEMASLHFDQAAAAPVETVTQEGLRMLPAIKRVLAEFPAGASKKLLADALRKAGASINDRTFGTVLEALEAGGRVRISRGGTGKAWVVTDAGIGA